MKFMVVEDFFDGFVNLEQSFKDIKTYDFQSHPEQQKPSKEVENKSNSLWPGYRSEELKKFNPFLVALTVNTYHQKFGNFIPYYEKFNVYTHFRYEKDNAGEFAHYDSPDSNWSMLVYLSKTNLESGTRLYDKNKNTIADIKFVQNRAFIFDSNYLHSAVNNHGTNIDNGRLTLNLFWR